MEVQIKTDVKPEVLQCAFCEQEFVSFLELKDHMFVAHGPSETMKEIPAQKKSEPTMCTEFGCGKTFGRHNDMLQHYRTAHLGERFTCDQCGNGYTTKQRLKIHIRNAHDLGLDTKKKCKFCDMIFETKYILGAHMRKTHPGLGWKKKVHDVLIDPENPTPDPSRKCKWCGEIFASGKLLAPHVRIQHPGMSRKRTTLDWNEIHNKQSELKNIAQAIKDAEEAAARVEAARIEAARLAGAEQSLLGNQDEQQRDAKPPSHGKLDIAGPSPGKKERLYFCELCDSSYAHPGSLKDHINEKHDPMREKHACDICDYTSGRKWRLQRHKEAVHDKLGFLRKSFTCDECPYSADSSIKLKEHLVIHEGVKFVCNFCPTSFTRERILKKHVATGHNMDTEVPFEEYGKKVKDIKVRKRGPKPKKSKSDPQNTETLKKDSWEFQEIKFDSEFEPKVEIKENVNDEDLGLDHSVLEGTDNFELQGNNSGSEVEKESEDENSGYDETVDTDSESEVEMEFEPDEVKMEVEGDVSDTELSQNYFEYPSPKNAVKKEHKCDLCGAEYLTKCSLADHKIEKHNSARVEVGIGAEKMSTNYFDYLITKHEVKREHKCDICGAEYLNKCSLADHKREKHDPARDKFSCDMCDYQSERKFRLKRHKQAVHLPKQEKDSDTITKIKSLFCEECGYATDRAGFLREHMMSKHSGIRFFCEHCNASYSLERNLKAHISRDHFQQDLQCDQCEFQTKRKAALQDHIRLKHEGIKFQCDRCEKSFARERDLKKHISDHDKHGIDWDGKWHCTMCESAHSRENDLKRHMKAHEQNGDDWNGKFKCNMCDSSHGRASDLKKHIANVHDLKDESSINS